MKPFNLTLLCLLTAFVCTAQKVKDPDEILKPAAEARPRIFMVGSFHFAYYNQDANKVEKDKQINILSNRKQAELKQLLDYISKFKPTKIAIEATEEWNALKKYRDYKSGKTELTRDEREQVAFRLMERFNLDTVYSIDASSLADDMPLSKDSAVFKPFIDSVFKDYNFRANEKYNQFFKYYTSLTQSLSLLDFFKYINSQKIFQQGLWCIHFRRF